MSDYTTIQDIEGAAKNVGATLVYTLGSLGAPRTLVRCVDGWHAARFLVELCKRDDVRAGLDPIVRTIRARARTPFDYALNVQKWVKGAVRFQREHGEIFQGPKWTLENGFGDCDDHARLVRALLVTGGVPARLAFLHKSRGQPAHVCAQAKIPGLGWTWVETTVDAKLGEHPVAAAKRLGRVRGDLTGTKVTTMGETGVESGIPLVQGCEYALTLRIQPNQGFAPMPAAENILSALGFLSFLWGSDGKVRATWTKPDTILARTIVGDAGSVVIERADYTGHTLRTIGEPDTDVDDIPPVFIGSPDFLPVSGIDDAFWPKLVDEAKAAGDDPLNWALVMLSESDLHPTAGPGNGNVAVGINQFSTVGGDSSTFETMVGRHGFSIEDYLRMPASRQLDFAAAWFAGQLERHPEARHNVRDLYWLNFLPGLYKPNQPDDFIITTREAFTHGNPTLTDSDGAIRAGNLTRALQAAIHRNPQRWPAIVENIRRAGGGTGNGDWGKAIGILMATALAAGATWYATTGQNPVFAFERWARPLVHTVRARMGV